MRLSHCFFYLFFLFFCSRKVVKLSKTSFFKMKQQLPREARERPSTGSKLDKLGLVAACRNVMKNMGIYDILFQKLQLQTRGVSLREPECDGLVECDEGTSLFTTFFQKNCSYRREVPLSGTFLIIFYRHLRIFPKNSYASNRYFNANIDIIRGRRT